MKKRGLVLLLALTIMAVGILTACNGADDNPDLDANKEGVGVETSNTGESETKNSDTEEIQLSDWDGEWNSITWYLDEEDVKEAYEELAERHDMTAEEAKKEYAEEVEVDFMAMKIDNDEISFYKEPNGELIETSKYTYVKSHEGEHGGRPFYWYEFEAEDDVSHKNILLMDVHGEETMPHFHMRYGENIEELVELLGWNPTLVSPTATMDQVYEEIAE